VVLFSFCTAASSSSRTGNALGCVGKIGPQSDPRGAIDRLIDLAEHAYKEDDEDESEGNRA
jgi:hypothetical protein